MKFGASLNDTFTFIMIHFFLMLVFIGLVATAPKSEYSDQEIEMKMCDPETTPEMRSKAQECLKEHFTPNVVKMIEDCARYAVPDSSSYQEATETLCKSGTAKRRMTTCIRGRGLSFMREMTLVKMEEMMNKYKKCAGNALGLKKDLVVTYVAPDDASDDASDDTSSE